FRSLVFFTEVTTTRFLTVQCIVSHQLTDFDEISQADCLFKFYIQFISFTRNAKVAPEGLSYFFQFSQSSSQRFLGTSHTYKVPHDVTQLLVNRVYRTMTLDIHQSLDLIVYSLFGSYEFGKVC